MFLIINAFIFLMMTISTLSSIESKNWWELWFFLELNSLAFTIFILNEKNNENIFVFLLFQALASSLIIVFIFLSSWSTSQTPSSSTHSLIILSILINIGIFPFHTWIISVINNLSWMLLIVLFSWQNLIPLLVVINTIENTNIIFNTTILSLIVLNFLIIKLTNINVLITLSSLVHNTWIFAPILIVNEISLLYLLSYSLILIPLINNFLNMNINNINTQIFVKNLNNELNILMLSISGVPPFIGFLMNIFVLLTLTITTNNTIAITILTVSSCMSFFIYIQIFIKYFYYENNKNIKNNSFYINNEINEVSWVIAFTPSMLWY